MGNKQNATPLKKIYIPILKRYDGKKILWKKLSEPLTKICKKNEIRNELFSFTQYQTSTEIITIGESFKGGIICFGYNNLVTQIGRAICYNEFNYIIEENKFRMPQSWRSREWHLLMLKNFFMFQIKLFEYSEEMTFKEYASGVLNAPEPNKDDLDYFGEYKKSYSFIIMKDNTKGGWPNIKWELNTEKVQITRVYWGIEVLWADATSFSKSEYFDWDKLPKN